ncbi:FG-GAP repeat domain-containing protein [Streptomyces sp. NPDC101249]|uniref:FG-GAP repeat domain-containing protein n=1 Tax=Streptomyces sp. NPDC101249 TaxID=3366140 RepID=UPI00381405E3
MLSSTAGGPPVRRVRGWHAVVAAAVVTAVVVAFVLLRPSGGARAVPNSPCAPVGSAREAAPATPDLDGDGAAELTHEVSRTEDVDLTVVPGSAHGPDGDRTVFFAHGALGLPDDVQVGDDPLRPTAADLDEDGRPDLVVSGAARILWGAPGGPRVGGAQGRVRLPGDGYRTAPVAGDFDGDGHVDLVAFREWGETRELIVLKGPFARSGAPARTVTIPAPGFEGTLPELVAGDADDDGATDLVLHDTSGSPPLLFTGGADTASGLSGKPERLPRGENVVFGDFDGDGRQDIAVGRSFVDSYDEVGTPHRRGRVSLRYGKDPGTWVVVEGGGFAEGFGAALAAGDFDGDGCDDLAVQLTRKKEAGDARIEVLRGGSAHGLGSTPWHTTGRFVPGDDRPGRGTLFAAADWDGDGRAELALLGEDHWWITDGRGRLEASFPITPRGRGTS